MNWSACCLRGVLIVTVLALTLGCVPTSPLARPSPPDSGAPLVLAGVTVIDVRDGQHVSGQTVVITGSRITALGPAEKVLAPKGATVVNARGKYVIPGLWDMHIHPHAYTSIAYPLLIANGITGARDAGSTVPLATLVRWKREIARGIRVGPRLIVSGPSLDQGPNDSAIALDHDEPEGGFHIRVPPALARRVVDSLHAAGADAIKTYDIGRAMYFDVAAEARRFGMMFGGHIEASGLSQLEASDVGARFLDHNLPMVCQPDVAAPLIFDPVQCTATAQHLRHNNTWIVSTPMGFGWVVLHETDYVPGLRYVPDAFFHSQNGVDTALTHLKKMKPMPTSFADWTKAVDQVKDQKAFGWQGLESELRSMTSAVHAGMPILAGTDVGIRPSKFPITIFGLALHEALVFHVLGGMTPLEALQTATLNPALALEATDSLGTVDAGKLADLVLLDADPLTDIWNTTKIHAVVANGRYFDRHELDRLFAQAERAARTAPPWETVLQQLP